MRVPFMAGVILVMAAIGGQASLSAQDPTEAEAPPVEQSESDAAPVDLANAAEPAPVDPTEPADAAEAPSEEVVEDKRRCRSYRPVGSRISQRICLKESEWAEVEAQEQRNREDARTGNRACTNPQGC